MKRRELIRRIADEAKAQELTWESLRRGGDHEVSSLDGLRIPVGFHREIDDDLARIIFRECESKLGRGWWR